MSQTAEAIIEWLPPEQGGRRTPAGHRYRCVVRFDADPNWELGTWTFGIVDGRATDDPLTTLATVAFVVEGAPTQLLAEGARFDLLEGAKVVATGVIVAPADANAHRTRPRTLAAAG